MSETKEETKSPLIGLLDKTKEELQFSIDGYYIEIFKGSVYDTEKKIYIPSEKAPLKVLFSKGANKIVVSTPALAIIIKALTGDYKAEWKESIRLSKLLAKKEEERNREQTKAIQEL